MCLQRPNIFALETLYRMWKLNLITKIWIGIYLTFVASQAISQQAAVEFSQSQSQSDFETFVVSILPVVETDISVDEVEFSVQYIVSNFKLMSGQWLLDKPGTYSEEEKFVRSWFLARKNVSELQRFVDVLDDEAFRKREEMYAIDEWPRDWEYQLYESYLDVRLLGLVKYGNTFMFLVDFKTAEGVSSGFTTIQTILINGAYRQSDATPGLDEATGPLLFSGPIGNELHRELKLRIGIQ